MLGNLNIEKVTHSTLYKVYGMNNDQWINVKEQAYISFSISSYCYTVLYNVIPLSECHVILGRVWQVDVKALYDDGENTYVFNKNGKDIFMSSLQDDKMAWGMSMTWLMRRRELLRCRNMKTMRKYRTF